MKTNTETRLTLPNSVLDAVLCQGKVNESPHTFYKYPARFSPAFAREVIRSFSAEGEVVLDPFCGVAALRRSSAIVLRVPGVRSFFVA
jgi:DNA modification methylase